ncbi:MAG: M23 family metallopeptidase [Caldilineaceae bacterium]
MQLNGGVINQTYLYGEQSGTNLHRGIDVLHPDGTTVNAIANGRVVALRSNNADNTFVTGQEFGNYVMIRHTKSHWDGSANVNYYVYSIYAHLKRNSITVAVNDLVNAGSAIAQIDSTGNVNGAHLHLQLVTSNSSAKTDPEEWNWSQNESYNPELWVKQFNYNGTQTATMIGRISDSGGNKVGGKYITGIAKPYLAEGQDPDNHFLSTLSYNYTWTNSDELLRENFATTDIQPGTYTIYARNGSATGSVYENMGSHTFVANQITYVGLDPVYLPDVRQNASGWSTTISVRNNTGNTNQVQVTYYVYSGTVAGQAEYQISPNGRIDFTPSAYSGFNGAAVVMATDDISVATLHDNSTAIDGYAGVEKPSTTVFVPIIQKNNSNWYSDLFIQNTSNASISVDVNFKPISLGSSYPEPTFTIEPWGFKKFSTINISGLGAQFVGSAKITSSQPLAVSSTQFNGSSQLMATSNSQELSKPLYAPLIQNNNNGYISGLTLLNTWSTTTALSANYYNGTGSNCYTQSSNINGETGWIILPAPPNGNTCPSVVSGRFGSGQNLAANVNQLYGTTEATTYAAISKPSKTVYVPRVKRNATWGDGIHIHNTEGSSASVTITFYNTSGSVDSSISVSISANGQAIILGQVPSNFDGSAVITSNRNIAVQVNNRKPNNSGDIVSSYPADHG